MVRQKIALTLGMLLPIAMLNAAEMRKQIIHKKPVLNKPVAMPKPAAAAHPAVGKPAMQSTHPNAPVAAVRTPMKRIPLSPATRTNAKKAMLLATQHNNFSQIVGLVNANPNQVHELAREGFPPGFAQMLLNKPGLTQEGKAALIESITNKPFPAAAE